jgi:hypothetical protein
MKTFFTVVFYIAIPILLFAQESISVQGKIVDASSGEALPYAHVYMNESSVGTVSNIEGYFSLQVPITLSSHGVVFSYLGYLSKIISIQEIQQTKTVLLQPSPYLLNEIIIKDAKENIVESAIEKIKKNYDFGPQKLTWFSRVLSKREETAIQASEAVFETYQDHRQEKKKINQLHLIKGRIARDTAAFKNIHNVNIGLSPDAVFAIDFVRNSPLLHNRKIFDAHVFENKGMTTIDNRVVYKISFDQREHIEKAYFKGIFYIDTASLAFVRIELGMSERGLPYLKNGFDNQAAARILGLHKSRWQSRNRIVEYKYVHGLWYLYKNTSQEVFRMIREKEGLNTLLPIEATFLVTEIKKDNISPFEEKDLARDNRHLERQYGKYDPDFWKGFNYQLADPGFKEAFEDILKRNLLTRSTKSRK